MRFVDVHTSLWLFIQDSPSIVGLVIMTLKPEMQGRLPTILRSPTNQVSLALFPKTRAYKEFFSQVWYGNTLDESDMQEVIKSPWVTGGLIVFGPFPPPSFCGSSTLFSFPGKPLKLISSNHTWLTYGCGKNVWPPSRWPWVKVTKLPKCDN